MIESILFYVIVVVGAVVFAVACLSIYSGNGYGPGYEDPTQ